MAGLSRMFGRPSMQATPLTSDVAAAIRATARRPRPLPIGTNGVRVDRGATRARGHRAGLNHEGRAPATFRGLALVWNDVERMADGTGRLTVRRSKTDQTSEGKVLYLSARSMADLDAIRPADAKHGHVAVFSLSSSQIGRRIARSCEVAGFPGAYSGHSPRVGMAQDLAANGAELPALMEAGRWESPTMPARYTRSQAAERGAVANYHGGR